MPPGCSFVPYRRMSNIWHISGPGAGSCGLLDHTVGLPEPVDTGVGLAPLGGGGLLSAIQESCTMEVLLPGTPAYESARRPAVAQLFHCQPAAIVRCRSSGDVAAAIGYAQRRGLPAVARSGG